MDEPLDCLIIGGGPAGLTAAIYLARFHLKLKLVDGGKSRAAMIPCTHNHAGFPDGISGAELIERMKEQAQLYGAAIEDGFVSRIESRRWRLFDAEWGSGPSRRGRCCSPPASPTAARRWTKPRTTTRLPPG